MFLFPFIIFSFLERPANQCSEAEGSLLLILINWTTAQCVQGYKDAVIHFGQNHLRDSSGGISGLGWALSGDQRILEITWFFWLILVGGSPKPYLAVLEKGKRHFMFMENAGLKEKAYALTLTTNKTNCFFDLLIHVNFYLKFRKYILIHSEAI